MRVLVTGGNGFIGSHLCEALRARGITPLVFDRRTPCDFLGDVRDAVAVSEAVAISDGVIHLAGVLGTQETVDYPQPAVVTNILGGLNVFEAVRRYDVPAVNIAVGNHWMNNPYSISKSAAERFCYMANAEWGTRIAVVRALNAYGPGQKHHPVRKIVPSFIARARAGVPIEVYGDGGQVMDMIYVADVADVLIRALVTEHGVYDRAFEAGTGRPTTVEEIARKVCELAGGGEVTHVPMRPGEPEGSVVLANPMTLAPLGLEPGDLVSLEEGLKLTWDSYV